jgi:cytochrome c-type biogenesis protein CcmH/NrfF
MQQIQFKMAVAIILVCVVAGAGYFTLTGVHCEDDPETEILKSLRCTCGCGRIAYDCQSMDCSLVRDVWKPRIESELLAGKTKEQIIDGFVKDYGERVLATYSQPLELPPIWIWIIPIASLVGVVIIYQYVRRRHRVRQAQLST